MNKKIRILIAKPGLDGHDRGMNIVARAFRDSGMEVVYLGLHQTPEAIVRAAIEEDVDVIALSVLSGAHVTLFEKVLKLLKQEGICHILITGGGIISKKDQKYLSEMGVSRIFGPGTPVRESVQYIQSWFLREKKHE
ncbi:MAG: cobalamin B12-binding domain-containing protein [Candidatus Omnitrophica bacterium]|nr:cobalamin B12-binding domain-containing protein [Candidatus Omnitrophota bacterium]